MKPFFVQMPPVMDLAAEVRSRITGPPPILSGGYVGPRGSGGPPPSEDVPPSPLVQAIFPTSGMW